MIVSIGLENRIEESVSFEQNSGGRTVLIQKKKSNLIKIPVNALLHNQKFLCIWIQNQ